MKVYYATIGAIIVFSYLAQETGSTISNGTIKRSQQSKFCLYLISLWLVCVAGLRDHVGTDFKAYITLFSKYCDTNWIKLFNLDEPIVPLIGKLCGRLFGSYQSMFFAVSLLTVGCTLSSTYHETNDIMFVTLLYVFVGCWHGSFNGIRQYLAVMVIYCGRKYIFQQDFAKYAIVCFIAFLCHKSALAFVCLYFIYSRGISQKKVILVLLGTVLITNGYNYIYDFIGWMNESEFTITEYTSKSVNILRVAVRVAPAALAILYAYSRKLNDEQVFYFYMLLVNAGVGIATRNSAYLARMGAYSAMFVPLGLNSITKSASAQNRQLFRTFIVLLYFIYWYIDVTNSSTLANYEWVLG